jgi:hypothetical protein
MLQNKENLTQLNLEKAKFLYDNGEKRRPVQAISQLPSLASLSLSGCSILWGDTFDQFCNSPQMQQNLKGLYLTGLTGMYSLAFASIGKLTHLEVLRIESCSWFNDDTFNLFMQSPLKGTLKELQLNNVDITDHSLARLNEFSNLKKLIVSNCHALTSEGRAKFLDLADLQKNLQGLLLNGFSFSDELAKKFVNFAALKLLIIENNELLTDAGSHYIWDIRKIRNGTLDVLIGGGGGDIYREFEQGFLDKTSTG